LNDCPFRYQGQYEDSKTGLYYNRFRYYSPDEGMYISQDPIGLELNNPTLYGYTIDSNTIIDLWGLDCSCQRKYKHITQYPIAVYKTFPFYGNHQKYNEYIYKKRTKLTREDDLKLDDVKHIAR
jgi:RHS family protein